MEGKNIKTESVAVVKNEPKCHGEQTQINVKCFFLKFHIVSCKEINQEINIRIIKTVIEQKYLSRAREKIICLTLQKSSNCSSYFCIANFFKLY